MENMTKEELKAEDCKSYKFLSVDGIHEVAEILKIDAGCESDAWDLLNEDKPSNSSVEFILSDKLEKQIKNLFNESNYKKGFNILMEYFDSISDEEKPKVDKQLKKLGL